MAKHTPRVRFQTTFPMGFIVDIQPLPERGVGTAVFVRPETLDSRIYRLHQHRNLVESTLPAEEQQRIIAAAQERWDAWHANRGKE